MNSINQLDVAIKQVLDAGKTINDEYWAEVYKQAPIIVYQRLCLEFSALMQLVDPKLIGQPIEENSKEGKLLTTIGVLKELYPELR